MTITLTPRLQAVAQMVPRGCRFADIGTDHAYLPVWLLQNQVITSAIAGDLRRGPLEHAQATARRFSCMERISFRLSDGLNALHPHEANCIAIAGMGGEAIRSILSAAPWTKEGVRLILQPQTNIPELRVWLSDSGYCIHQEQCIREEDRWYTVLLVRGGTDAVTWTPGTRLMGHPSRWAREGEWTAYLEFLLGRLQKQRAGLSQASVPDEERLSELCQAEQELNELLGKWKQEGITCQL